MWEHVAVSLPDEARWLPHGCALHALQRCVYLKEESFSPQAAVLLLCSSANTAQLFNGILSMATPQDALVPCERHLPCSHMENYGFPLCADTFLFHVAQMSAAAGNSCSMSGRTNVLIQQHPQGALFQHWWFQIRGECSCWAWHQVAVQVFSPQHPHLHPKRWCNPFQTIISHGTNRLFAPLYVDTLWFLAIADTIVAVISCSYVVISCS